MEETFDEIITGQGQRDVACSVWLHYTLDQLEQYLESLLVGDGRDQAIVTNVVQAFRRFKSLPAADDAAAVAAILAGEARHYPSRSQETQPLQHPHTRA